MTDVKTRPDTIADLLDVVARHLTITDKVIKNYCDSIGKPEIAEKVVGDDMQRDLNIIADWMRENDTVDSEIRDHLENILPTSEVL